MKAFTYLSSDERSEIEILKGKGYGVREIGRVLGRSPNTISLELKRVLSGYNAIYAKIYARTNLKDRRFQWSKIESIPELKAYGKMSRKVKNDEKMSDIAEKGPN